jgi:hypothetical protein
MRTVGFGIAGVITLIGLTYKLLDLHRDRRNPFLRTLCATLVLLVVAFTLGWPPIEARIEQATGVLGVFPNCATVAALASYQVMLLLWTYPPTQARQKIRRRLPLYTAAFLATAVLAVLGRHQAAGAPIAAYAERPEQLWGTIPLVAESAVVFYLTQAFTTIDATLHLRRYIRLADRRWLRRGLRLIAISNIFSLLYSAADLVLILALRSNVTITAITQITPMFSAAALLSAIVGVTVPSWGPRLDRFRDYRRIQPLWHAMYLAVPDVVLNPPTSLLRDRWSPHDLHFRLYRRLIEIRDSRLALRPFLDTDVAAEAHRRARDAGLACPELQAVVEAATLAAAIRAKAENRHPASQPPEDANTGGDLAEELTWFTRVAHAFVASPIVRTFATGGQQTTAQDNQATVRST